MQESPVFEHTLISESSREFVSAMVKNHGRGLLRFLAARLRSSAADAPDLVQEVFLRLLRVPSHESIRNPQAYLYTIASHVLHQHSLRRAVTTDPNAPFDIASDGQYCVSSDPAESVQLEQQFETLGRALQQHSPRAYVTLMMYRCEGATLEQIGRRLGVSRVMAKKYLIKAMTYCHQQLDEME